jgi:hypothetical protein
MLERLQAKQQVIEDLVEGRVALLEAAARFGAAQAVGVEDGLRLCQAVIGWAHLALRDRPEKAEALSQELEEQLEEHLTTHGGTACLPEV